MFFGSSIVAPPLVNASIKAESQSEVETRLPLSPFSNCANPSIVEHDGPNDQREGAEDYHADSHALITELLIQPARFFNCLGWISKAKNALDQGAKTDN